MRKFLDLLSRNIGNIRSSSERRCCVVLCVQKFSKNSHTTNTKRVNKRIILHKYTWNRLSNIFCIVYGKCLLGSNSQRKNGDTVNRVVCDECIFVRCCCCCCCILAAVVPIASFIPMMMMTTTTTTKTTTASNHCCIYTYGSAILHLFHCLPPRFFATLVEIYCTHANISPK